MGLTVATKPKQPREVWIRGYDFNVAEGLHEGDSVVLAGSSVELYDVTDPENPVDVSATMIVPNTLNVAANVIYCLVQAGVHGHTYLLTFLAATFLGEVLEEDWQFEVEALGKMEVA